MITFTIYVESGTGKGRQQLMRVIADSLVKRGMSVTEHFDTHKLVVETAEDNLEKHYGC